MPTKFPHKNFILIGLFVSASSLLVLGCTSSQQDMRVEYQPERQYVISFGDSLTRGAGLSENENYPSLLQAKIAEKNLPYSVKNEGQNGETTAQGLNRLPKVLEKYPSSEIRLFILALSGNDGLRQLPVHQTEQNLRAMLQILKEKQIPTLLVGLKFMDTSNFGRDRFAEVFSKLSDEFNLPLVEDMLRGVRLKPALNLPDNVHPNAQGTKIVFEENIWPIVEPLLPPAP